MMEHCTLAIQDLVRRASVPFPGELGEDSQCKIKGTVLKIKRERTSAGNVKRENIHATGWLQKKER
jgi:hypothetical protein